MVFYALKCSSILTIYLKPNMSFDWVHYPDMVCDCPVRTPKYNVPSRKYYTDICGILSPKFSLPVYCLFIPKTSISIYFFFQIELFKIPQPRGSTYEPIKEAQDINFYTLTWHFMLWSVLLFLLYIWSQKLNDWCRLIEYIMCQLIIDMLCDCPVRTPWVHISKQKIQHKDM